MVYPVRLIGNILYKYIFPDQVHRHISNYDIFCLNLSNCSGIYSEAGEFESKTPHIHLTAPGAVKCMWGVLIYDKSTIRLLYAVDTCPVVGGNNALRVVLDAYDIGVASEDCRDLLYR